MKTNKEIEKPWVSKLKRNLSEDTDKYGFVKVDAVDLKFAIDDITTLEAKDKECEERVREERDKLIQKSICLHEWIPFQVTICTSDLHNTHCSKCGKHGMTGLTPTKTDKQETGTKTWIETRNL